MIPNQGELANQQDQSPADLLPSEDHGQAASVDDVVSFVKNLCLTFSHLSLYPPKHPIAVAQMKKSWQELLPIFKKYGDLSVSLTEGKLLFFAMPVEEGNPVVSKFARHFESLHIHSIKFMKDISSWEFFLFFKFFSQDHRLIEEEGGIEKLMRDNAITHIAFNASVYRAIGEDEKIVKKSEVYRGSSSSDDDSKTEILRYFFEKMLDESKDERELLNEIKNDPEGLAAQIVKIVEEIGSGGKYDRDSMVEALLQNIQMVSETLGKKAEGERDQEPESLAQAMLVLENELKRKSKGLSSSSSIRFIRRITDVVSSYTDKIKAGRILDEFIKNERSLKSAEKMMKELDISGESGKNILKKIKDLMKEKNLDENQLLQHLEQSIDEKKTRRKISRAFVPIEEKIRKKIESDFGGIKDKDKLLEYLGNLYSKEFNARLEEKTREIELRAKREHELSQSFEKILGVAGVGFLILDQNGVLQASKHAERLPFKALKGEAFDPDSLKMLEESSDNASCKIGDCTVLKIIRGDDSKIESVIFQ